MPIREFLLAIVGVPLGGEALGNLPEDSDSLDAEGLKEPMVIGGGIEEETFRGTGNLEDNVHLGEGLETQGLRTED